MSEADHPPQPDDPQTVLPALPDPDEAGGREPRPSTWARRPPVITEIKSLFDQDRAEELPAPVAPDPRTRPWTGREPGDLPFSAPRPVPIAPVTAPPEPTASPATPPDTPVLPDAPARPHRPLWADSEDSGPAPPEPAEAELQRAEPAEAEPAEAELEGTGPKAAAPDAAAPEVVEPEAVEPEAVEPEVVDPALAQERPPALSVASSAAVRWARDSLATLGELDGRRMDRQAVDVNEHRIGKLEPEWNVPRRIRSFVILVVLTLFVAAVIAAVLAIAVEVLSVAVNHAVSKSAGA